MTIKDRLANLQTDIKGKDNNESLHLKKMPGGMIMGSSAFRPSSHGWPFSNGWATNDVCGGMCWSALDKFYMGVFIPDSIPSPPSGSALHHEIFSREKDSRNPAAKRKLRQWRLKSDLKISRLVQNVEWPITKNRIDANHPVPLMLVRKHASSSAKLPNHQVLAYRYEEFNENVVKIWVYDPNYKFNNNIYFQMTFGQSDGIINAKHVICSAYSPTITGEEDIRGFFVNRYDNPGKIADSNRNLPDVWFGGIKHQTIDNRIPHHQRRHRFEISFAWGGLGGNIPVDFSILKYLSNHDSWIPVRNSEYNGQIYEFVRCQEIQGARHLPIEFDERTESNPVIRIYILGKLIKELNVIYPIPYVFALPYVHNKPYFLNEPVYEPDWSIKDLSMTDVIVMQETVSPTEMSNLQDRILEIRGDPVYRDVNPSDRNSRLIGFQIEYKIGCLTSKVFSRIYKGYLGDVHGISYQKMKRSFGAPVTQPYESGSISEQQLEDFEVFCGFNIIDFNQDQTIEFEIHALERQDLMAEHKTTFYAKSLLSFLSPVYGSMIWDLAKFKDIHQRVHEYIDKALFGDMISEMPANIRKLIKLNMEKVKKLFKNQADKHWKIIQREPDVVLSVNSIYHNEFEMVQKSGLSVMEKIKNRGGMEKFNDMLNNAALDEATEYLKDCLIKKLYDGKVFNKILSRAGIKKLK